MPWRYLTFTPSFLWLLYVRRALRAEDHPNHHHHPNSAGSSASPFHILLLILVGSGATLLLTQIVAYASGEDNTGGSNVGGGGGNNGNGHLRNLSPRGYVNDGTLLASTVYHYGRNSNSNSVAAASQARADRAGRSGNEAASAAAATAKEEEADPSEEAIEEKNVGAAAAGRGGDGSADPARPEATSNHEEGEGGGVRRHSDADSGGGTIIGPDTQGGDEEEEERSLYFPRRSDPDSHKLFHDDIKMDKPWDMNDKKEKDEDPWPEPDITALDPTLVVTRNGVTHPAVAWLMSFPNRCVRMWRRNEDDEEEGAAPFARLGLAWLISSLVLNSFLPLHFPFCA
jgi:hypothetical protein